MTFDGSGRVRCVPNTLRTRLSTAESCPAAAFALVVLGLRAAAVVVAAGRGGGAVPGAGLGLRRRPAGARRLGLVQQRAGAGAGRGAGTQGGHGARAGHRAGLAARGKAHLLAEILLRRVRAGPLRGLGAAAEGEEPAQLQLQDGAQARRQLHGVQHVRAARHGLAEPGAAQVLQGGGRVAGTDHLHAALSRRGANHGVELLVLQPRGRNACRKQHNMSEIKRQTSDTVSYSMYDERRDAHLCSAGSCRR